MDPARNAGSHARNLGTGSLSRQKATRKERASSCSSSSTCQFRLQGMMGTKRRVTPVFGCKIDLEARVYRNNTTTFHEEPPKHEITYRWYREYVSSSSPTDKIKCSVHPDQVATVQCRGCVKLKLSLTGSYHCSSECYYNSPERHRMCHRCAKTFGETSIEEEEMLSGLASAQDSLESPTLERDGKQWVEVCSSKSYSPTAHDIGCSLLLQFKAVDILDGIDLCPCDFITTDKVLYPPGQKPRSILSYCWKSAAFDIREPCSEGARISILTYNILASCYVNQKKYPACAEWARSWEYRRHNLLHEITGYDADILCLQEVQSNHLENFFRPELEKCGYSVLYKRRRASYLERDSNSMDGCAIFYRKGVFKEIMTYERAFDSSILRAIEELQPLEAEGPDEAFQRLKKSESDSSLMRVMEALEPLEPKQRNEAFERLKKDNVALIVILEKLESEGTCDGIQPRICVANTHISANPNFPDAKLFQVVDLITGLDKIAEMKIPLLVCGDFNSLPLSEPHRFITAGRLENLPKKDKNSDPFGICQHLNLHHSTQLKSAYASFRNSDGIEEEQRRKFNSESQEPLFTHFTSSFTGTLDYIFYTEDSLKLDGVLELLDRDNLGVGIPSLLWSSDHIALMARFVLNSTSPQQQGSQAIPAKLWP